MTQIIDFI